MTKRMPLESESLNPNPQPQPIAPLERTVAYIVQMQPLQLKAAGFAPWHALAQCLQRDIDAGHRFIIAALPNGNLRLLDTLEKLFTQTFQHACEPAPCMPSFAENVHLVRLGKQGKDRHFLQNNTLISHLIEAGHNPLARKRAYTQLKGFTDSLAGSESPHHLGFNTLSERTWYLAQLRLMAMAEQVVMIGEYADEDLRKLRASKVGKSKPLTVIEL